MKIIWTVQTLGSNKLPPPGSREEIEYVTCVSRVQKMNATYLNDLRYQILRKKNLVTSKFVGAVRKYSPSTLPTLKWQPLPL